MRILRVLAIVLLAVSLAVAGKQESLEELKAKLQTAKPSDQPKLSMKVAEMQLEAADKAYDQGDGEQGRAAVQEMLAYCEKAASTAKATGKRLKETEIQLRDLQRKLENLHRAVDYDERDPLKAAANRLEEIRSDLLSVMFGKKK